MKRFNWIDILIVLVLVAALAFAAVKLTSKEPAETVEEEVVDFQTAAPDLRVEVVCRKLSREIAENAVAALQEEPREFEDEMVEMTRLFNSNKLVNGRISRWEIADEPEGTVELRLTIDAIAEYANGSYRVGTQEVRIGKDFIAKTMSMELNGTVISITELEG